MKNLILAAALVVGLNANECLDLKNNEFSKTKTDLICSDNKYFGYTKKEFTLFENAQKNKVELTKEEIATFLDFRMNGEESILLDYSMKYAENLERVFGEFKVQTEDKYYTLVDIETINIQKMKNKDYIIEMTAIIAGEVFNKFVPTKFHNNKGRILGLSSQVIRKDFLHSILEITKTDKKKKIELLTLILDDKKRKEYIEKDKENINKQIDAVKAWTKF